MFFSRKKHAPRSPAPAGDTPAPAANDSDTADTGSGAVALATFAAGCFWGVQESFNGLAGVVSTEVGYTGGTLDHPTYEDVCEGGTGHAEAVRVSYDPEQISYRTLLRHFLSIHDPTQFNRQGPDVGHQYRSAIFHHSDEQRELAQGILELEQKSGRHKRPVVTEVAAAGQWWRAEKYHQNYFAARGMAK
ncbi:MAG: peptide-methionine (S)-S-oxide reductase MsrA [Alphaproteobacteria bacterium]|nr:peptide-methionine (S)-S-oxide reductase MsrA [Alphaproteobacteria bacterium]